MSDPLAPDSMVARLDSEGVCVTVTLDGRTTYLSLTRAQARLLRDQLTQRLAKLREIERAEQRRAARRAARHPEIKRNDSPLERFRRDIHE